MATRARILAQIAKAHDLNEPEALSGVSTASFDFGYLPGKVERYGLLGTGVDETAAFLRALQVGYGNGSIGQALDFGSCKTIVISPVTMNKANLNVPPAITGHNTKLQAGSGSGVLVLLENPHSAYRRFSWENIIFDAAGICSSAFRLYGSQNCLFGPFTALGSTSGAQFIVNADAGHGVYYNLFLPWGAGFNSTDGGGGGGFEIKVLDGSNRINGNVWMIPRASWNAGKGFDMDRVADLMLGWAAELNDGDGMNMDNTTNFVGVGGYTEHNNEGMSGGGASDGTGDVSIVPTANSNRFQILGGRHIGLIDTTNIGLGPFIIPGQANWAALLAGGMGFGGANPPGASNGFNFASGTNVNVQVSGATKFRPWNAANSLIESVASHSFQKARIGNRVAITYSASMTPDATAGEFQEITANNGTAFTINAPTGGVDGDALTINIKNTSGGALGAITFNAAFHNAGAYTAPATGNGRSITWYFNGTVWYERNRSPADVAN